MVSFIYFFVKPKIRYSEKCFCVLFCPSKVNEDTDVPCMDKNSFLLPKIYCVPQKKVSHTVKRHWFLTELSPIHGNMPALSRLNTVIVVQVYISTGYTRLAIWTQHTWGQLHKHSRYVKILSKDLEWPTSS